MDQNQSNQGKGQNQNNQQNQDFQKAYQAGQINPQDLVRIDVTGGDPQAKRTIVTLLSRMLKDQLPNTNIDVLSQDQQIKQNLDTISTESGTLQGSDHLQYVLVVADDKQSLQFQNDPMFSRGDLQFIDVPMAATDVSHERSRRFVASQQGQRSL